MPIPTAFDIANTAKSTLKERGKQRDTENNNRSMASTITAFNAITGKNLSETDGWILMVLLKLRRCNTGEYNPDHFIDGCGYFALAGESAAKEASRKNEFHEIKEQCNVSKPQ